MTQRIALVSGGNRGLGFEICRQLAATGLRMILGSRDPAQGEEAAARLTAEGLTVVPHELDVTNAGTIQNLSNFIAEQFGRLDVLINNAGIALDGPAGGTASGSVLDLPVDVLERTLNVNAFGPCAGRWRQPVDEGLCGRDARAPREKACSWEYPEGIEEQVKDQPT